MPCRCGPPLCPMLWMRCFSWLRTIACTAGPIWLLKRCVIGNTRRPLSSASGSGVNKTVYGDEGRVIRHNARSIRAPIAAHRKLSLSLAIDRSPSPAHVSITCWRAYNLKILSRSVFIIVPFLLFKNRNSPAVFRRLRGVLRSHAFLCLYLVC